MSSTSLRDPAGDKFADCAIAAHADSVITADRDLLTLTGVGYKPQPVTPEKFIRRHMGGA